MKKLIIFLFASVFLNLHSLFAQPSIYLKMGGTYSYLKESSYSEPGVNYLYGIGKDWSLYRWIHLRTELLISHSSTALKNKSVQASLYIHDFPYLPNVASTINYFNIDIQLRYLEIPLLLKMEKSLRKNLSIGLEIGYSLKFPPKDSSKATVLRRIKSTDLTEEERQNFRFDYRITGTGENYSYQGRGLCPTVGTYVILSRFQVGLRYQVDYINWVSSIVIGKNVPLRIFSLSMGYQF
ncbi:MAG TPA: hypothetical protein ENN33_10315 [Ignavibacteria bacterium]|nr:hypothetical protein [Ignavibacteria bacterium]